MQIFKPNYIKGVYFIYREEELVYIGYSTDIEMRIRQHRSDRIHKGWKLLSTDTIRIIGNADLFTETELILDLKPRFNILEYACANEGHTIIGHRRVNPVKMKLIQSLLKK